MTAPARPESHHFVIKHRLVDGFQYSPECFLHQLVLVAVDAERSGFPVVLGNFNPSCRFWFVGSLLHPRHQVYKVFFKVLPVFLFGHPVDSYGLVSVHLFMTLPQKFYIDQMGD